MRISKKKWLVFLTLALVLSLCLPLYAEDSAPVLPDNPPAVELAPTDFTVDSAPAPAPLRATAAPSVMSSAPAAITLTVAPGESAEQAINVDIPSLPPQADVVFCFDLTGSMSGILNTAKSNAVSIMNQLNALGNDIDYGVVSYMDYPHSYNYGGYSASYGSGPDYAYRLNSPVTADDASVAAAINGLKLGNGDDGPEDYARPFFESYADPGIAWREGAKKVVINFADSAPHDYNINEGVKAGTINYGGDPGRDEVIGNEDDLDFQTVLQQMNAHGITLLECHSNTSYQEYWNYWTGITGGSAYVINTGNMVDKVVAAVTTNLTTPVVKDLHLQADNLAAWFSFSPASYPEVTTGTSVPFTATITVPDGTPQGTYNVCLSALDKNGVNYGDTSLEITVPDVIPPTAEISYDVTGPTNGNVTASLVNASEPIVITNNGGSDTYTFTDNGSFTFEFQDLAGNTATATATVNWIDRIPPTAEIAYSEVNPTTGQVTATLVNPSEPITITNNGGSASYTFANNGSFTFNFRDAAGNTATATATVSWIVKANGHVIFHSKGYAADGTEIASMAFDVFRNSLNQQPKLKLFGKEVDNPSYHPNGMGFLVFQDLLSSAGIDIYGPKDNKMLMGDLISFGMSDKNAAQKMLCFECRLADKSALSINGTQAGTVLISLNFKNGSEGSADFLVRIFDANGSAGGNELYRCNGVLKPGLLITSQWSWE